MTESSISTMHPVDRFKDNMSCMVELIVELLQKANDQGCGIINMILVDIGVASLESYSKKDMIEGFIGSSFNHWRQIHSKNEDYIETHIDDIFKSLPMGNVHLVQKLLKRVNDKGELVVTVKDRDDLWELIQAQVRISMDYIHLKQHPNVRNEKEAVYEKRYIYQESYTTDGGNINYKNCTIQISEFQKISKLFGYKLEFRKVTYSK